MTEDQVMLGAAMMLLKRHGVSAQRTVAERIGELSLEGDEMGVAIWKAIAARMNEILRAGSVH